MSWVEAVAAVLVVVNVALLARRSVWNYPVAIVAVTLYFFVFREARLYSDMILQLFFLILNIYGWRQWRRSRAAAGEVRVERLRPADRWAWGAGVLLATIAWGTLMHAYTDAAWPWWDAGIAITSVAAQAMLAGRKLENWVLWIGVDVAAVVVYAARDLWPTAILYLVLLILSVRGLRDWQAALRRQQAGVPA